LNIALTRSWVRARTWAICVHVTSYGLVPWPSLCCHPIFVSFSVFAFQKVPSAQFSI